MNSRFWLAWLLRLVGGGQALAFMAVVMPRNWMEEGHRLLGMGEMAEGPLLDFMIRQASYVYGMNAVMLVLLSLDVPRYRPLIYFVGAAFLLSGPTFLVIDLVAGMPWFWTAADGIGCTLFGAAVLWLTWKDRGSPRSTVD